MKIILTEHDIYILLLKSGAAGDNVRHFGQPSLVERIAHRQAKILYNALQKEETNSDEQ